jgi:putative nucleotidyltransferase with HDIG domain
VKPMPERFVNLSLSSILVGIPLPGIVYVFIDNRYLAFRGKGDTIDRVTFDRLEFKNVANLYIASEDVARFLSWGEETIEEPVPPLKPENVEFPAAREDAHRKTLDIFQAEHPDKIISGVITASRKLVTELMKFPYAIQALSQLQTFSRGTVDHSVNVAVLSVYLAIQMGYSHGPILQNLGLGGLLHDIGKRKVTIGDGDSPEKIATMMKEHPTLGVRLLDGLEGVSDEVKQIVAQHHEYQDGTGFPRKLRGTQTYDLARIVAIANTFDELVGDLQGTLVQRQKAAIGKLDKEYFHKYDQDKLDKAIRILKMGV